MNTTTHYRVLLMLLFVAFCGRLEAASLKVSPAGFIIHNVVPGKAYDVYKETGLQLTVYNDSAVARTYVLSAHRPSEGGNWEKGYLEVPDPTWCWFDHSEITVEANSNAYARFHLRIPDEERYYNQHWVVTLTIAGKPGAGGIGVAINVRAQIETQSRADVKGVTPDGLIGIVPSILNLKADDQGEVVIFNNSRSNETYKIYPLADKAKYPSYVSAGFTPLPQPDWVKLGGESVTIPAGGRKGISVKAVVPAKSVAPGEAYETVVFLEGREATGFVRIRITRADTGVDIREQKAK